jgi:GT2 family glycosyltransferase
LTECLARLTTLTYPDFEVIVVNDGSSDASAEIARAHGVRLVETAHRGLSHARNVGVANAIGEIVAFLDDDAYPDHDWLYYIAASLRANGHAGVGGPNIAPDDDGLVAECVAAAPGGPIHVLISDREAEHLPGCNMAFRKSALEAIGSFDERFRVAGDDVDVCWRLQESGRTLGFSAGAVVMHRRRDSLRRYLKQQYGYGEAEALLERKWPSRYNSAGSSRWSGRIYDSPASGPSRRRPMIRYGTWGGGLFQSIYEPAPGTLSSFLLAPECLLLIGALGAVSALGTLWSPLLIALLPFCAGVFAVAWRAILAGWTANPSVPGRSGLETLRRRDLTALLFFLQPVARLAGRLRRGLSPWRRRLRPGAAWPRRRTIEVWSEDWQAPQSRLQQLQDSLAARGGLVRSGGPFDRWDLELRAGPLGGVKIRTAVEEHGSGRQLLRARIWPRATGRGLAAAIALAALTIYALLEGQLGIGITLAIALFALLAFGIEGTGTALSLAVSQLRRMEEEAGRPQAGERAPELTGPSPKPQLAQWHSLPREADATLARRATAIAEGRELRR